MMLGQPTKLQSQFRLTYSTFFRSYSFPQIALQA